MAKRHDTRRVKSDETLFAIVNELHDGGEIGVSELADRLDLSKSAVHKHLKTLEAHGYVHNAAGQYALGLKFLEYGGNVRDKNQLYSLGRAKVQELAQEIGELVILSVKEFDRGVFLFRWNDQYNLKETIPLGDRFYLHQNAAGKAMLAELSDDEVADIVESGLPRATSNTLTDKRALKQELNEIRERGFATNRGERDEEVSAISAAVQHPTGGVGAISVSVPSGVAKREDFVEKHAEVIMQTASKLSLRLKHA